MSGGVDRCRWMGVSRSGGMTYRRGTCPSVIEYTLIRSMSLKPHNVMNATRYTSRWIRHVYRILMLTFIREEMLRSVRYHKPDRIRNATRPY